MSDDEEHKGGLTATDPLEDVDFPDGPGIFPDSHREFLLYQMPDFPLTEWDGGDENQVRWRIRRRVKNALYDFSFLSDLPKKELELIFDDVYNEEPDLPEDLSVDDVPDSWGWVNYGNQWGQLRSGLEFIYRAVSVVPEASFEDLAQEAVTRQQPRWRERDGHREVAGDVDVDVSIDVNISWKAATAPETVLEQLESNESVTDEELGRAVRYFASDDDAWEKIRDRLDYPKGPFDE